MKCNQDKCLIKAEYKIVHNGVKEVVYCEVHLRKYQAIMQAMGCPEALVYPVFNTGSNECAGALCVHSDHKKNVDSK